MEEGKNGETKRNSAKLHWKKHLSLAEIQDESVKGEEREMLREFADMWSGKLGRIYATEHHIQLKPVTIPPNRMQYLQGPEMRGVTQKHIYKQPKAGVI